MDKNTKSNGHKPARTTNRRWTVMVYLAGDNNLTSQCITVLQQLEAVKYNGSVPYLPVLTPTLPGPKAPVTSRSTVNGARITKTWIGKFTTISLLPKTETTKYKRPISFATTNREGVP